MRSPLLIALAAAALSLSAVTATLTEVGRTVDFNGIHYYVPPKVVSIIGLSSSQISSAPKCPGQPDLIPFTVFTDGSSVLEATTLASLIKNYTATDDVFNVNFLSSEPIL